ncbi:MAG: PD40 domain-containing protein [Cyclobacteriaceae bacterium]|nr:PD40 domain-containing protein [Cyclobacteriaceae bacterium]UYN86246.1 MAG: PD40 domain-containing protein [Cyclobacteriaceae bacterium]
MFSTRYVLVFLAVAGTFVISFSQDTKQQAQEYLKVAELMREGSQADNDIREVLVIGANLDPENLTINFEAGRYHLMTIQKDLAVQYFMRVYEQDPNYRFHIEYLIGQSYQYGLQFDKAIEFYNRYKDRVNKRPNYQGRDKVDLATVDRNIQECENGKEFVSSPKNYSIVNISREINSEWDDYAPVLNAAEDEIIFTSRRKDGNMNQNVDTDNKPFEDIFISKKVNGVWQPAENIGPVVNSIYHDSNLAFSADGQTLFIYKTDNGGDIYYSERKPDGSWGVPVPLPGIINSSFEEKSITISPDEKTLYFSSNRPGGFGGLDLYKATLDSKGEWSSVKNLGPKINTSADDDGPFIDYDGKTLYFSSKGRKGMGGFDIYKSVFDEATNEWTEPENLGYPINTPDNDIFFVSTKDGKRAYYSSVREDGLGYDDIYMITIPDQPLAKKDPEPVSDQVEEKTKIPLRYIVSAVDAQSKEPVDARIRLEGLRDNIIVPSSTKQPGKVEFRISEAEAKDYRLSVESEGYMFVNQNVRIEGASDQDKEVTRTIELRKLQTGMVSILRNIYFDFNKATFKQESYNELNKLERMMQQNPGMKVEIAGHTDNIGTAAYNMALSQRRAEAVKDFLTKKGIDARRITAIGFGKTKPLASNDDEEEGRELNRRVEFKVISN